MNEINISEMNGLISAVSKKLGVPEEQLKKELQSGKFDTALKNMKPAEEAMFNKIVGNPKMLEQFMSTPQAKALYQKLTNG